MTARIIDEFVSFWDRLQHVALVRLQEDRHMDSQSTTKMQILHLVDAAK
jgi:hypothetical protein